MRKLWIVAALASACGSAGQPDPSQFTYGPVSPIGAGSGTAAESGNGVTVYEGVKFVSALSISQCLDIAGGSFDEDARVEIWTCNNNINAQMWTVVSGRVQARGGRCLDLQGGTPGVGVPLVTRRCTFPTPNSQLWTYDNGALQMSQGGATWCAQPAANGTNEGTPMVLSTCNDGAPGQSFTARFYDGQASGGIALVNTTLSSATCLSAPYDGAVAGAPARVDNCRTAMSSGWIAAPSAEGVRLAHGGVCLQASSDESGAGISFANCDAPRTGWAFAAGQLRLHGTSACLTFVDGGLRIDACDAAATSQHWSLAGVK